MEATSRSHSIRRPWRLLAIGLINLDPAVRAQVGSWRLVVEKVDDGGTLVTLEVPLLSSGGSSSVLSQNVTTDEDDERSVTVVMTGPARAQ
jgi:hypothetical protein